MVQGHVVDFEGTVTSVVVTVDGGPSRLASRLAVPVSEGVSRWSWGLTFDDHELPAGDLRFVASVIDSSGLIEVLPAVTLAAASRPSPGMLRGALELPVDDRVAAGEAVMVAGWVADAGEVDRIEVVVDGDRQLARMFCIAPPPMAASAGLRRPIGFDHLVAFDDLPRDTHHSVAVEAVGRSGRTPLGDRRLVMVPGLSVSTDPDQLWLAALSGRVSMAASRLIPGDGLNLLVMTEDLGAGDPQQWLFHLLSHVLADWDVSCTILATADGVLRGPIEEAGARVHLIGPLPRSAARYESALREIVDRMVDDGTNMVLVNGASTFIGVDAAERCHLPSVYVHHGRRLGSSWSEVPDGGALDAHVTARWKSAMDAASAFGVMTGTGPPATDRSDVDRVIRTGVGVPSDLQRAVTVNEREALRRRHGYLPHHRVLVSPGPVSPDGGQTAIVLAFARIADVNPGANLLLLGRSDGGYTAAVEAMVQSLGLAGRVRLVEDTAEVGVWWTLADGLVSATDADTMSRSIAEAVVHRVPVLTVGTGATPSWIRDAETGWVVAVDDIGALAEGMQRLLGADLGSQERMVQQALDHLAVEVEGGGYPETYRRLLRGLVKEPGASPRWLVDGA